MKEVLRRVNAIRRVCMATFLLFFAVFPSISLAETTINFDGLTVPVPPGWIVLPPSYEGLEWSLLWDVQDESVFRSSYYNTYYFPSGSNAAFNDEGVESVSVASSRPFVLNSLWVSTWPAYNRFQYYSSRTLTIEGYYRDILVGSSTINLSANKFDFWVPGITSPIDTLIFKNDGKFRYWLMDDLSITPVNQPPVADAGSDQTVECACQIPGGTKVQLNGSGSSDPDGDLLTYTWTGPFAESPASGPTPTVTLDPGCLGTYAIILVVNDGNVDSEPDTVQITVVDTTPPTIICPEAITVEAQSPSGVPATDPEIQAFLNGVSASDNCNPSPEITDDSPFEFPLGDTVVTFSATDVQYNTSSCQATVTVADTTPPAITIIAPEPYGLYSVGNLVLDFSAYDLVSGNIEPPALSGTLTDAAGFSGPVVPGDVPSPGVYTLLVGAEDDAGNYAESDPVFFVVYDPSGGFVTGGGWIESPEGAYKPNQSLSGKANFGFVSKYKKGATIPTGNTEFVFKTADLNFHSSSYDWLVVTGSNYARFKGTGTINGYGEYRFMLWAGDGPDTFRIRIWTEDDDGVETDVYDNGFDQAIEGGSIIVHTD